MGEQYRQSIEDKISELGADKLRVFINEQGVNPHYRQHLEDTFREAGVRFVSSRDEANLIFEGDQKPSYQAGQIAAFFNAGKLLFAGGL